MYLEKTTRQADSLASKIQDLEMELVKEKEECKRLLSVQNIFTLSLDVPFPYVCPIPGFSPQDYFEDQEVRGSIQQSLTVRR